MAKQYLVSIDSGTQSTRVMILDTQGNRVVTGSAQHPPTSSPQQGWHEHGRNDLWDAFCTASNEAFAKFQGDKADIVGIGVSSQRICVNITDQDGNLIHNPISWMDGRWHMNYASLGAMPEDIEDPFYRYFMPYLSMANWMKFNNPAVYEKAGKYLNVTGYLNFQLTGETKDAYSNNIGWPYDTTGWSGFVSDRYIELMGFRKDQLAEPVLAGGLIGNVTAGAAAATGMPEGCPVFACAGDKQCEVLGIGGTKHGQAYITLGTLSGLDVVSTNYTPSPDFSYNTYMGAYPETYNYEAFLGKGFWLVSWFRENFGSGLEQEAKEKGLPIEALLDIEAEALPAGAEGLIALPDWSPGTGRPYGKGMFIGFDDRHRRAHVYRALIEGIVMEIKTKSTEMFKGIGIEISELYVGGGGSKSDFCVQAIADVFNLPVYRTKEPENTSIGVAMCAAVGSGVYANLDEAITGMIKPFDRFDPKPENHKLYEHLRCNILNKLYPTLEAVMKDLVEFTAAQK